MATTITVLSSSRLGVVVGGAAAVAQQASCTRRTSTSKGRQIWFKGAKPRLSIWRLLPPSDERSGRSGKSPKCCAYKTGSRSNRTTGNDPSDGKLSGVTLYDLLGISTEVGIQEIKMAYREKARRYHPDANPPSKKEECTKIFLQVQEAYEVLADPDSRANYDYSLRHPLSTHALKTGFPFQPFKRRSTSRNGESPRGFTNLTEEEDMAVKQAWRIQWESQLDGLKRDMRPRKKESSWAANLRRQREREDA